MQMWTGTLCVFLSWICVGEVLGGPEYMVAIPAVIEAGAETKFCASLLKPNETLLMTITLISPEESTVLLKHSSSEEFHTCTQFKAPLGKQVVQMFEVEVKGDTFYSKAVRKVMIKAYQPKTFIQTDKPIYLPGQTVHFRVVSLDAKFRPANCFYNIIEMMDVNRNRIGQWLNETSNSKILQLSYSLNSDAREGTYRIHVSAGEDKVYHNFKVEKYVLPKFDVKIKATDKVVIRQEEIKAKVCAKYTYGQSVPGSVTVEVCRPLSSNALVGLQVSPRDPKGVPEITAPCYNETKQMDKKGCTTFMFKMSAFTIIDKQVLLDVLDLRAKFKEEGTGISQSKEKRITISYVVGKLSFIDTPKVYDKGSNVEGKVKAVDYNDKPIPDMPLYLLEGIRYSPSPLLNLTTDSDGVATFSFSTANFSGNIHLYVNNNPNLEHYFTRTAYYLFGDHTLSLVQKARDTRTVSSLEVKKLDKPLSCNIEEEIFIKYTFVGESHGSVDVIYLVLSRGAIALQGHTQVELQEKSVNDGEVSFKLKVSPEMAPYIQVVAYVVLPSEAVIAKSADFFTEKCFSHKVSLEFSPSSAVPGEETTMQVTAEPDSLCGVSAVDQSVLIKEPGKILDADKIFDLLPVRKVSHIPYEVQDPTECLTVRAKRYVLPFPGYGDKDDPYTVFQNVGLKIATNLFMRMPSCVTYNGREYHYVHRHVQSRTGLIGERGMVGNSAPVAESALIPVVTVRTFFPETWIWDLVDVGSH